MKCTVAGFVAVVLSFFVLSAPAFAQSSNASLGGTVSDASGALIPGVTVTATNTGTGIVTTVLSNETGTYQFPPLQPGALKLVGTGRPGIDRQHGAVGGDGAAPGVEVVVLLAADQHTAVDGGEPLVDEVNQRARVNFTLQVGGQAQTVEVSVAADTLIATTSASVGVVLPEYKLRDLPLGGRDVTDLVNAMPGVVGTNISGAPTGFSMTTRDGIPVNQGRYNPGVFTQTFISPDLVDEVRIIVAPADAEFGRGSGQVQMATRSGTNEYRGSVFWANRNSVWDAATFNNNFNNLGKDYLNRNQYGGRFGGPIVRNKTFFFFLYEGQRTVQKAVVTPIVLTPTARQGIFRYFPGVPNAGATAAVPSVDLAGNPVRPAASCQCYSASRPSGMRKQCDHRRATTRRCCGRSSTRCPCRTTSRQPVALMV